MAATAPVTNAARRILVVADDAVDTDALHDTLRFRTRKARDVDVLVVAPALNTRLRYWLSDEDEARRAAAERLTNSLERLRAAGFTAEGLVADADPLRAIGDALALFPAHEIVVATNPSDRAHWLARDLVRRARLRFAQPIVHVAAAAEAVTNDGGAGSARASARQRSVERAEPNRHGIPAAVRTGKGAHGGKPQVFTRATRRSP